MTTSKRPRKSAFATQATASSHSEAAGLFDRIVDILEAARGRVVRAVNSEMVLAGTSGGRLCSGLLRSCSLTPM